MKKQQLEIGLATQRRCLRTTVRQRKVERARWWFNQMRRVVDQAIEGKAEGAVRQEEDGLPLPQGH